jgi:transcriptional regulator with XRE-family HTH domain
MDGEKKPNNILRRERQLRGWSQQKVAELVGTSEDVVSRWERGERKPSPFFQEKFCVLYGKNAEELGIFST